jgi:NAD(P)-dependent dehydrogenase (short-subunit alcohol dehydrogenase family)
VNFQDKTVIVTGAGMGIGRASARVFAEHGANVVVNALEDPSHGGTDTVRVIKAAGGQAIFTPGDVSDPDVCAAVVNAALARFGRLDVLINNAGVVAAGTVETTENAALERMLAVNVKGPFFMSRVAMPALRASRGVIVNTGSVAALKGHKDRAGYAATKGAVVALTRSMAADHVAEGVRVNCVCPGTTLTPALQAKIDGAGDPAVMEAMFVGRQPLGRLGRPEEIAYAIAFAASDEAAYMTGSIIVIDGGMIM